jgi:hypothetical protein
MVLAVAAAHSERHAVEQIASSSAAGIPLATLELHRMSSGELIMTKHRFSIVTAATAAWALVSWLMVITGTPPRDATERSTTPAAEQPESTLPGAVPDGHHVGAELRPAPDTLRHVAAAGPQGGRVKARFVDMAPRSPFDDAMSHYQAGRYARAFTLFSQLADCGHREAARIAMQMRRFGPQLYGMDFAATAPQIAGWLEILAATTEPAADRCTRS